MPSSILDGREEAGRSCRHRPSRTEMIITFLACVEEKNHDRHHDREDNQWQEKGQQDGRKDGLGDSPGDSKCNRTDRGDEDVKIRNKW